PPAPTLPVGGSEQVPERAEVEVEVLRVEPELLAQLLHALVELHEGAAEPLDLVVGEAAAVDAAERLPLHELAEQLHDREHQLREAALQLLGIRVHAACEGAVERRKVARERVEVQRGMEDLVSHGPVK